MTDEPAIAAEATDEDIALTAAAIEVGIDRDGDSSNLLRAVARALLSDRDGASAAFAELFRSIEQQNR